MRNNRIYCLYKRIMKRDPKAIDEIESLEEGKQIISMIVGNFYLHGEVYRMDQEMKNNVGGVPTLKNI